MLVESTDALDIRVAAAPPADPPDGRIFKTTNASMATMRAYRRAGMRAGIQVERSTALNPYLMSLALGLLAGIVYALFRVRSPAPPVIALVGLLGILVGEQLPPLVLQAWSGGTASTASTTSTTR